MIDTAYLTEKLETLSGLDFEEVEREERKIGNTSVDVSLSKSFQARLAARALGVDPFEIKKLPLNKYARLTMDVMTFLFADSAKEETPSKKSEESPST